MLLVVILTHDAGHCDGADNGSGLHIPSGLSGRFQFMYGAPKYEKPFFVRSIWNDGEFTYIKADAHESPTLYEIKDGQPSLVNFQIQQGTYQSQHVAAKALAAAPT